MRLQLALNVEKIDESIDYYSKLFNTAPHKIRPGYANFAIDSPPLKLVLFENPGAAERINHLGVELNNEENLAGVSERLSAEGLNDTTEQGTTCCFAKQDKVWSTEPQGLRWEWYKILDDNPDKLTSSKCCA